jgi:hypothetical protein
MPSWVKIRPPEWKYVGWIDRESMISTFEQLVERARQSDHGETREVDIYQEGAACWVFEATT